MLVSDVPPVQNPRDIDRERIGRVVELALEGRRLSHSHALVLAEVTDLGSLTRAAEQLTVRGFGSVVGFSPKVFIPLTQLCRDVCHYCTFAHPPTKGGCAYLSLDEMLSIARAGAQAGCREALFTLGDKPELRYPVARRELSRLGVSSTIEYLGIAARAIFEETGLLPHLNPGVMNSEDIALLRPYAASMGIMLETSSLRLSERGMPHHRSPDKNPERRLETLRAAGALSVPFTSGILIGIGESRLERVESLLAIRDVHEEFAHIQEVIVQNFRAKPGTRMARHPHADSAEHQWTIAIARLIFGSAMSIQAPPNLSPGALSQLVAAGVNDWGGSPRLPSIM